MSQKAQIIPQEALLSYWREQLAGAPQLLQLPTDSPRPAVQSFRGARQAFVLPAALTQGLMSLSRQQEVTLFMTLLAAFQTLLYRYSNQDDLLVGTPIANRTQTQTEELIGFFVNTLVLRARLSGELSFREFLRQAREVALGAYAHQDLPFERLVEELHPDRDQSYNLLVQVLFALQNAPMESLQLEEVRLSPLRIESGVTTFDLVLELSETPEGELQGHVTYSTDLFEASTISRLLGHFQTLLEGIVADPEQPLDLLPLLTEAEGEQLLIEWKIPKELCIHQLFEAQVASSPEAVAVVCGEEQLSYEELNRRANQLAHYLQQLGVGPEVLVGLCMQRSLEILVGMLGILKAGGAYLPLDPSYPKERLAFMLKDSHAAVLLTEESLRNQLPEQRAQVVYLDSDWATIAQQSQQNPNSGVHADNLAYVIYTSGSTGQPKGVAIENHSTVTLLNWARKTYSRRQLSGVLASTSICFDLSIFEIFVPFKLGWKSHSSGECTAIARLACP